MKDVMGAVAIAVRPEAALSELVETMRRFKVGAVAVIDAEGRPIGVVSEDDLLPKEVDLSHGEMIPAGHKRCREHEKATGTTARDVMTSPALTVVEQTAVREAARLMNAHRIKQLPVVDVATGKIVGTVHQVDLLKIFSRRACDVLADVAAAVARLSPDPKALTIMVDAGVVRVAGKLARRSQIAEIVEAGRRVDGVVDLDVDATYDEDDVAGSR
ncbi:CBS domain-containing protein [Streptosporangium sp. NPDC023963]|uniref:CBS domain-containing protein n=1 Tax=Streptosporangium sp. NPDC023963 TaxID=3155608 RepID=UPI0034252EC7